LGYKRDSLKIATHLATGRLKGIRVPSREREDKRAVTRLRDTFVKERSRLACQIKSLLHQHGLIKADDKKMVCPTWIKQLKALIIPEGLAFSLNHHMDLWLHLNLKIKEINKEIEKQAEKDGEIELMYRSVPGIGPTSARILANELEDTLHFDNERRLFSYIGLTPSEHSSGDHVRQGHITRQGKPILRKILIQVAWKAVTLDLSLQEVFERLTAKIGKKRTIVGIARRLAGRIRACFRTGEFYRVKQEMNDNKITDNELQTLGGMA
jgi:transposase